MDRRGLPLQRVESLRKKQEGERESVPAAETRGECVQEDFRSEESLSTGPASVRQVATAMEVPGIERHFR
jgi:hypothetical protein